MKSNRRMATLLLLNLMMSMTAEAARAAEAQSEIFKHNGENGMRVNMHRRNDSEVLWSADPQHGWVQTKQKYQNKTQDNAKQKKQKNHGAKH